MDGRMEDTELAKQSIEITCDIHSDADDGGGSNECPTTATTAIATSRACCPLVSTSASLGIHILPFGIPSHALADYHYQPTCGHDLIGFCYYCDVFVFFISPSCSMSSTQ